MGRFIIACAFRVGHWGVILIFLGLLSIEGTDAVEIRRLSVPRYIQNGTEDAVVLDCEYVYTENDFRLVVKWFFEDNLEPVYQWIPGLNKKHASEMLKDRLDLNFSVSTVDAYSRFRALRILRPTTELSGKYTCLVTSLAGQDSKEQVMTVFVPAHEFELGYMETSYNTVNVSCETLGVFPFPNMRLDLRPSSGSPPQAVTDVKTRSVRRPSGSYDVLLHRTFMINELSSKGATVFECILELPGTSYFQSKRIAYFPEMNKIWRTRCTSGSRLRQHHDVRIERRGPQGVKKGIQGPRIEAPYGLSSCCPRDKNLTKNLSIFYMFVIVVSHLFKNLQQDT